MQFDIDFERNFQVKAGFIPKIEERWEDIVWLDRESNTLYECKAKVNVGVGVSEYSEVLNVSMSAQLRNEAITFRSRCNR